VLLEPTLILRTPFWKYVHPVYTYRAIPHSAKLQPAAKAMRPIVES
jgi:hypothetical protein